MLLARHPLTGLSPRLAGWSPTLPMGLGGRLGLGDGRRGRLSDWRAAMLGALDLLPPLRLHPGHPGLCALHGPPVFAAALLGTFCHRHGPGPPGPRGPPAPRPTRAKPTLLRLVGVMVIGFALLNAGAGLRLSGVSIPSLAGVRQRCATARDARLRRRADHHHVPGRRRHSPDNIVIYAGYPSAGRFR